MSRKKLLGLDSPSNAAKVRWHLMAFLASSSLLELRGNISPPFPVKNSTSRHVTLWRRTPPQDTVPSCDAAGSFGLTYAFLAHVSTKFSPNIMGESFRMAFLCCDAKPGHLALATLPRCSNHDC